MRLDPADLYDQPHSLPILFFCLHGACPFLPLLLSARVSQEGSGCTLMFCLLSFPLTTLNSELEYKSPDWKE